MAEKEAMLIMLIISILHLFSCYLLSNLCYIIAFPPTIEVVSSSVDGIPFLMRDRTLRRTTDVRKVFPARQYDEAAFFNWTEIRSLNAGQWFLEVLKSISHNAVIYLKFIRSTFHKCLHTVELLHFVLTVLEKNILHITSPVCCCPLLLEWPLLDSRDADSEGPEQNRQPDGVQSGRNAASGSQVQQLCTAQYPQTSTRAPTLPELVHGHSVGCAESRDFQQEGEDCRSLYNKPLRCTCRPGNNGSITEA